ncbi:unnamed protein product [Brugia pahangi]|uniref:Uncharacterized protein n=1 Tax=Brugia pahangi TaxID=6280 RepID=A0A0N4TTL4_BRUPA|nr:unnamed protein product [Brugia pahangi]
MSGLSCCCFKWIAFWSKNMRCMCCIFQVNLFFFANNNLAKYNHYFIQFF